MQLHEQLFDAIAAVRYVAVKQGSSLQLNQREALAEASESESDRYEELLVNPAVLQLTRSRGEIDCGGLEYVLVRYGNFFQFVQPIVGGHVSIAIETDADLAETIDRIRRILEQVA